MKINASTLNTASGIAQNKQVVVKTTTATIDSKPTLKTDNIEFLQHGYAQNQYTRGLLTQLKTIVRQFIDTPNDGVMKQLVDKGLERIAKHAPKYTSGLKNLGSEELYKRLSDIGDKLDQESETYNSKIAYSIIAGQNNIANKTTSRNIIKINS